MKFSQKITAIDSHTMGEPARVIVSGPVGLRGATVSQKRDYLRDHMDFFRRSVINEPRGHSGMFAVLVTEPCHPSADVGLIFMDNLGYVNMCVHATIAATVVLLETGLICGKEPLTSLTIEMPSGLVRVDAEYRDGKVARVHLINVPSFTLLSDSVIKVRGREIILDVSYGGNFFAIVSADQVGVSVRQTHIDELIDWGMEIKREANRQLAIRHPENEDLNEVHQVVIYGETTQPGAHAKNIIVSGVGKVDRSPCGTGTCARLASLYSKGVIKVGETFVNEGIIGTCYACKIIEETAVGEFRGIIPMISGNAYITGFNTLLIDESDPLKHGFMLKEYR
jgi:proline racemase